MLEQLILHQLRDLEEIPESIGDIMTLKFIQINCCGSGVDTSATKIQEEQQSLENYELQVQITPMVCSFPTFIISQFLINMFMCSFYRRVIFFVISKFTQKGPHFFNSPT